MLLKVADFLGMNVVTGGKTLSILYRFAVNLPITVYNLCNRARGREAYTVRSRFFTHEFKLNWGPFELAKKRLIKSQVQKQINKLRKQDEAVKSFGIDQIPKTHLQDISSDRSFNLAQLEGIKKEIANQWLPVSLDSNIDNSTLLWFAVLNYGKNDN